MKYIFDYKNNQNVAATIYALLLVLVLQGCTTVAPDLSRLYYAPNLQNLHNDAAENLPPVIVIHGVFGARLNVVETNEELWPGSIGRILFSEYKDLALSIENNANKLIESNLQVTDVTDKVAGKDFYGAVLRVLEKDGGYIRGVAGDKSGSFQRRYYLFVYDWRQDIVQTARKLDDLIEQIRRDYESPNLKVNIVAHSMGGLVTRYYLRYGRVDVLDDNDFPVTGYGNERVNKVVLLGTPNLGSISSLQEVLQGFKVGFNRIPSQVMLTWPATYQLFPHPIHVSMINMQGDIIDRDLFDIDIWRQFEWAIFNSDVREEIIENHGAEYYELLVLYFAKYIERARRFVWSLSVPTPDSSVKYIVFGGDCELTPSRFVIEEYNNESYVRLYPEDIANPVPGVNYERLMLEPGDGRVTKPSLFARDALDPTVPRHKYSYFPLDYAMMLCEQHDTLTGNIHFQDNLLNVLLTQDKPREKK